MPHVQTNAYSTHRASREGLIADVASKALPPSPPSCRRAVSPPEATPGPPFEVAPPAPFNAASVVVDPDPAPSAAAPPVEPSTLLAAPPLCCAGRSAAEVLAAGARCSDRSGSFTRIFTGGESCV